MNVEFLVLHTTAYDGEHDDLSDIIRWHKERGFRTIGYHYYIRKDGTIRKGRDNDRIGAHCSAGDMNFKSLGICFEGYHDKEEWTGNQEFAFYILSQVLIQRHHLSEDSIIGHREAFKVQPAPKTCPGKKIDMDMVRKKYGKLAEKKVQAAELIKLDEGKIDFKGELQRM